MALGRRVHTPAGKTPPAGQRCNGWDKLHSRVLLLFPPTHFDPCRLIIDASMGPCLVLVHSPIPTHLAMIIDSSIPRSGFKWADGSAKIPPAIFSATQDLPQSPLQISGGLHTYHRMQAKLSPINTLNTQLSADVIQIGMHLKQVHNNQIDIPRINRGR